MALTGLRAQTLLTEVLDRIRPHLPPGVRIEMLPHRKWTTLAQGTPDGGYATTVRGVGAFSFLPRGIRSRVTAQQAVETVLEVAYWVPATGGRGGEQDFDVRAVITGNEAFVSYRPPGAAGADARVELAPIPLRLL